MQSWKPIKSFIYANRALKVLSTLIFYSDKLFGARVVLSESSRQKAKKGQRLYSPSGFEKSRFQPNCHK
jgi:hypothetical protein